MFKSSNKLNTKQGIIKWLILIIITIMALSYFNIDIKSFVEKPQTKQNLMYIKELGINFWDKYLSKPYVSAFNNIFVGLLQGAFKQSIEPNINKILVPNIINTNTTQTH